MNIVKVDFHFSPNSASRAAWHRTVRTMDRLPLSRGSRVPQRFLLSSGTLKQLATEYGISYPTIRLRLDRLIEKVRLIDEHTQAGPFELRLRMLYADGRLDDEAFRALLRRPSPGRRVSMSARPIVRRPSSRPPRSSRWPGSAAAQEPVADGRLDGGSRRERRGRRRERPAVSAEQSGGQFDLVIAMDAADLGRPWATRSAAASVTPTSQGPGLSPDVERTSRTAASYFSRTLGSDGPMAALDGTSDWRPFELPFFLQGADGPERLEIGVVLPSTGTVEIGPLELVRLDAEASGGGAWLSDRTIGALRAALIGTAVGVFGAAIAFLVVAPAWPAVRAPGDDGRGRAWRRARGPVDPRRVRDRPASPGRPRPARPGTRPRRGVRDLAFRVRGASTPTPSCAGCARWTRPDDPNRARRACDPCSA